MLSSVNLNKPSLQSQCWTSLQHSAQLWHHMHLNPNRLDDSMARKYHFFPNAWRKLVQSMHTQVPLNQGSYYKMINAPTSFKILRGKNQHKSPSRVFVPSFCYSCNLALYFSNRMCRLPLVGRLTPVCISCYLPVSPCPPAFTMHPQPSFTFTTSVNTKLYSASMPLTLACQVLN
mgnify:CR=1 FL=1